MARTRDYRVTRLVEGIVNLGRFIDFRGDLDGAGTWRRVRDAVKALDWHK